MPLRGASYPDVSPFFDTESGRLMKAGHCVAGFEGSTALNTLERAPST
jgi:hypothetical protein